MPPHGYRSNRDSSLHYCFIQRFNRRSGYDFTVASPSVVSTPAFKASANFPQQRPGAWRNSRSLFVTTVVGQTPSTPSQPAPVFGQVLVANQLCNPVPTTLCEGFGECLFVRLIARETLSRNNHGRH